jgi:hypothetical protein
LSYIAEYLHNFRPREELEASLAAYKDVINEFEPHGLATYAPLTSERPHRC